MTLFGANLICILLIAGNLALLVTGSSPITGETNVTPYRVHLPSATSAELQLLPGIGPKMAKKIVEYRLNHEINTADDLIKIHGIGEVTVEGIGPLTTEEPIDQ